MKQSEWKVFFEGSLWGHSEQDHAGREVPLNREFSWGGYDWLLPSVYICGQGLVADLCARVEPQRIRAWMDKWNLSPERDDPRLFTKDEQLTIAAENPLRIDIRPSFAVNGTAINAARGSSTCWNPLFSRPDSETNAVMAHYGLDPQYGWVISRHHFPWASKKRPEIWTLSLTMKQDKAALAGDHFRVKAPGDQVAFVHPATGLTHVLTVVEMEARESPVRRMAQFPDTEFPTHFQLMSFTVEPETELTVLDCAESDRPRPDIRGAFGIIGGADGPTALTTKELHAACSAAHFEPVEDVEWRTVFYDKPVEDLTVELF
ncbi:MAG: hypothetical protein Q4F17_12465 [Eubacteriales bacterium]|nr:hypothetical protein [Eubacteriales bacterium]